MKYRAHVAIRLFLERGAILTDAAQVRRAYRDAFVTRKEESEVVDFFMLGDGECLNGISFDIALRLQSREYEAVEALLRCEGALS